MMFQCWPTVFDAGPTLKQIAAESRVADPVTLEALNTIIPFYFVLLPG